MKCTCSGRQKEACHDTPEFRPSYCQLELEEVMPDDPKCFCGHLRSKHDAEPPYECDGDMDNDDGCPCYAFSYERNEE